MKGHPMDLRRVLRMLQKAKDLAQELDNIYTRLGDGTDTMLLWHFYPHVDPRMSRILTTLKNCARTGLNCNASGIQHLYKIIHNHPLPGVDYLMDYDIEQLLPDVPT